MKKTETDVGSALKQVKTALQSLRAKSSDIDNRIGEINQTIGRLQQGPISLDDFGAYLHNAIVNKGKAWLGHANPMVLIGKDWGGDRWEFNKRPWVEFEDEGIISNHKITRRLLSGDNSNAAIFAVFPDQVCDAILNHIKAEVGDAWGNEDAVPVSERRALIASLKEERSGLEAQRNSLQVEIDAMVEAIQ